ncbi:amidohydrolase family protein [Falsiroseomonas stagni]|uniref:Aminocarboxymuconate-semialdehyde decarboxylase n=1 Tax=Falsiroseomonas stagni DSM 19981 TaxID=1123062 RepID=A0A1I4B6F0_9PROT|nr:amidohydrolase family protein [Falsiroseomonas stagni]SFK64438.1 aminocarboxymuconate-semialdehyde decarboxylase [Falsiroseomonas stagni DSM 19981]
MTVIDSHTHILTEPMIAAIAKEVPSLAPKLTRVDDDSAVLEILDVKQNPFPRSAWDLERRFAEMAAQRVDMHVVCNIPHTFLYEADGALADTVSEIQNEAIGALVRQHPDRFIGMATVAMQSPMRAAATLERAITSHGLRGLHVGSNIAGRNLDDPALDPVWEVADRHGLFILVHPHKVVAAQRMGSYYLTNLVGNPLETTIAAASLVFGGVIERHPNIRFCLSHAGGFTPFQAGRFRHGWKVRKEPHVRLKGDPAESLARFIYDSITHAPGPLRFLLEEVGADRIIFGTDYPFDMGTTRGVEEIEEAIADVAIRQKLFEGNARRLFGLGA